MFVGFIIPLAIRPPISVLSYPRDVNTLGCIGSLTSIRIWPIYYI